MTPVFFGSPASRSSRSIILSTVLVAVAVLVGTLTAKVEAIDSITVPDGPDRLGFYPSLVLDAGDLPVVSYQDLTNNHLKIMHCNDLDCAGGDESITTPSNGTPSPQGGSQSSIALDDNGYPVVSFPGSDGLNILHCNDVNCAGDDESITVPTTGDGTYTSLELDENGNPVVSFYDSDQQTLRLLHCDDPNCGGGGESIETPDPASGNNGAYTSLELDDDGYPVVSYQGDGAVFKLLHCNDQNCSGGDESITTPDPTNGSYMSMKLDEDGYPVASYIGITEPGDLQLLHCNDANCADDDDSITGPNTTGLGVPLWTSLALDSDGFPVVSFATSDSSTRTLALLHCNDKDCAGMDDSISSADSTVDAGLYNSLALDLAGNPVVAYHDATNDDLRILHCDDPYCVKTATLQVTKQVVDGGGTFDLLVDGEVEAANVGDGGSTGPVEVLANQTVTVAETTDGDNELGDYAIAILCLNQDEEEVATTGVSEGEWTLEIDEDDEVECVITNTFLSATVEVTKEVVNDGGATFDLLVDGEVVAEDVADGGSTGPLIVGIGQMPISESAAGLAGVYLVNLTCTDQDGTEALNTGWAMANADPYEAGSVTLAADAEILCLITNVFVPETCRDIDFDQVILGTSSRDVLVGTSSNDLIFGFGGDDYLYGRSGDDCLVGASGDDRLRGDQGTDVLLGGEGRNRIIDPDPDTISGGDSSPDTHGEDNDGHDGRDRSNDRDPRDRRSRR